MKDYSRLNELYPTVPFRLPPIPTGMYEVMDEFDTVYKYHFRRMPRAMKYTGRYGLFVHHPDAHWLLVGWVNNQNEFQRPVDLLHEYDRFLSIFLVMPRKLLEPRCCWCGKKFPSDEWTSEDAGCVMHPSCLEKYPPAA